MDRAVPVPARADPEGLDVTDDLPVPSPPQGAAEDASPRRVAHGQPPPAQDRSVGRHPPGGMPDDIARLQTAIAGDDIDWATVWAVAGGADNSALVTGPPLPRDAGATEVVDGMPARTRVDGVDVHAGFDRDEAVALLGVTQVSADYRDYVPRTCDDLIAAIHGRAEGEYRATRTRAALLRREEADADAAVGDAIRRDAERAEYANTLSALARLQQDICDLDDDVLRAERRVSAARGPRALYSHAVRGDALEAAGAARGEDAGDGSADVAAAERAPTTGSPARRMLRCVAESRACAALEQLGHDIAAALLQELACRCMVEHEADSAFCQLLHAHASVCASIGRRLVRGGSAKAAVAVVTAFTPASPPLPPAHGDVELAAAAAAAVVNAVATHSRPQTRSDYIGGTATTSPQTLSPPVSCSLTPGLAAGMPVLPILPPFVP